MKKEKLIKSIIEKAAIKIATMDANSTCPCISYQPIVPKSVNKLRKF